MGDKIENLEDVVFDIGKQEDDYDTIDIDESFNVIGDNFHTNYDEPAPASNEPAPLTSTKKKKLLKMLVKYEKGYKKYSDEVITNLLKKRDACISIYKSRTRYAVCWESKKNIISNFILGEFGRSEKVSQYIQGISNMYDVNRGSLEPLCREYYSKLGFAKYSRSPKVLEIHLKNTTNIIKWHEKELNSLYIEYGIHDAKDCALATLFTICTAGAFPIIYGTKYGVEKHSIIKSMKNSIKEQRLETIDWLNSGGTVKND